jgi:hypothetical protein
MWLAVRCPAVRSDCRLKWICSCASLWLYLEQCDENCDEVVNFNQLQEDDDKLNTSSNNRVMHKSIVCVVALRLLGVLNDGNYSKEHGQTWIIIRSIYRLGTCMVSVPINEVSRKAQAFWRTKRNLSKKNLHCRPIMYERERSGLIKRKQEINCRSKW